MGTIPSSFFPPAALSGGLPARRPGAGRLPRRVLREQAGRG